VGDSAPCQRRHQTYRNDQFAGPLLATETFVWLGNNPLFALLYTMLLQATVAVALFGLIVARAVNTLK
jgi:hypothetical protein